MSALFLINEGGILRKFVVREMDSLEYDKNNPYLPRVDISIFT